MSDPGSLHLLGLVGVDKDGARIPLRGSQSRLLLGYLAVHRPRPVPVEELADVLWPDGLGDHWRGALRGVVAKLRAFLRPLGPEVADVVGHRGSYALVCSDPTVIDVEHARASEAAARRALRADDLESAATHAARAAEILREPLLPRADAEWITTARVELEATCRRAHRTAAQAWSALGQHEAAVAAATTAVGSDPYDDVSQRTLLAVHLAAGNRSAGLRTYERFRQLLGSELGVEPDDATQALYVRLLGPPPESAPLASNDDVDFVGRRAELSTLADAWSSLRGSGGRVTVALHGGAGTGKTRLAMEAARRTGARVLYGRATEGHATPDELFVQAIGDHLASVDAPRARSLARGLEGPLGHLLPTMSSWDTPARPRAVQETHRGAVFEAFATVLRRIAVEPTVLVLDDVQAADAATHRLARHLLGALDDAPLLVLATYRDDDPPGEELARTVAELHRLGRYRTLPVGGLSVDDVAALLDASGATHRHSAPFVHARTGGNPLFVVQLLRAGEDGEQVGPGAVPATISELVRFRLATLDDPARSALDVASVIGPSMPGALLDSVLAVAGVTSDAVDRLVERRLLAEEQPGDLRFEHTIVRDAVYELLPDRKRRRIHGWVAEAIAAGRPVSGHYATLAHHYDAAGDEGNLHEWYDAMRDAAGHAVRVHAYEQAQTWARRIVRLVERRPEAGPMVDALLLLGSAQRRSGDLAGAARTLSEARGIAIEEGRAERVAEAVLELVARGGRGAAVHLPDEERVALLSDAVDRLGAGSPAHRAPLLAERALALLLTGRGDDVDASAREAERLATAVRQPKVKADTVVASRLRRATPEHADQRRQQIDELLERDRAHLSEEQLVRLQLWLVTDCFELGDRARLDDELRSFQQLADVLDQAYWRWLAASWVAVDRFVRGHEAEAERLAREALERVTPLGHPEPVLSHGIQVVGFRIRQGRAGEIVDLLDGVRAAVPGLPGLRCARTAALARSGRVDEARSELEALTADEVAALPRDASFAPSLVCLAEACHDVGTPRIAERLLPELARFRGRFVVANAFGAGGACHGPYEEPLALLHRCLGDEDAARRSFDRALDACERFGATGLRRHVASRVAGPGPSG